MILKFGGLAQVKECNAPPELDRRFSASRQHVPAEMHTTVHAAFHKEQAMAELKSVEVAPAVSRDRLAELLNEDLSREYQAIIAYVVYSQVLKGAEFMNIADQLQIHARQELEHALIISRQIDYLGKMPVVESRPVRTSDDAREMLRFDLENENETIRNYRDRVRQCEALGEYSMAEQIRQILVNEQDHQIDLATALGEEVPDINKLRSGTPLRRTG
jgi:bacterioferritin